MAAHTRSRRERWARSLLWPGRTVVLAFGILVLIAAPAAADPASPTDFRSEVDEIVPEVPGIRAEVLGGDAFLRLSVGEHAGGRPEVVVPGYRGEPYLRFTTDGRVEENRRSEAAYLNQDRGGRAEIPPGLDPGAEPRWVEVSTDGSYAWHDHRIHWMAARKPTVEATDGQRVVDEWVVPLVVDGEAVEVRGSLVLEDPPSALGWVALAAASGLAVWLAGRRRPLAAAVTAAGVGAAVGLAAGWVEWAALAEPARGSPLVVLVPIAGLAAWVVAVVALSRGRTALAVTMTLAAASALVAWALSRVPGLTHAVLVSPAPPALDRTATALALAMGLSASVLAVSAGALVPRWRSATAQRRLLDRSLGERGGEILPGPSDP